MEHFYNNIEGWFGYAETYANAVNCAKDGDHFVEVGAWKGRSTSFMAVEIANSGKQIKFDVVDTWKGSEEHQHDAIIKDNLLFETFKTNLKSVEQYYTPFRTTSLAAATAYLDNSLSFVMIDASHDYENVKADILAWLPKVKSGGILAGDDFRHDWPGVIQAVQSIFPMVQVTNTGTWIYKKS